MKATYRIGSALAGALLVSACVPLYDQSMERDYPPAAYSHDLYPGYGTVYAIDVVRAEQAGIGVGAVAGAVVGGLIGHQVGEGDGNTAATVIGAVGGALVGHQLERQMQQPQADQYRLTIRMENGAYQSVVHPTDFVDLRVGDRVRIDNGSVRRY
ncbi:glycine zipper 2TM domain-containing protein [Dechloromonas sp. A34]|uniref:glycine zipper 2TM domain-containing protein n=1 Tax=Dechloromonas sp. A34 TaxID=447588 RepID=UPI0022499938|nr:glycine zipper 2TM domain-containing protein [Dechloromonas sp. A34]